VCVLYRMCEYVFLGAFVCVFCVCMFVFVFRARVRCSFGVCVRSWRRAETKLGVLARSLMDAENSVISSTGTIGEVELGSIWHPIDHEGTCLAVLCRSCAIWEVHFATGSGGRAGLAAGAAFVVRLSAFVNVSLLGMNLFTTIWSGSLAVRFA
jgi:hypothetical protein